jgi:hypothetical protein
VLAQFRLRIERLAARRTFVSWLVGLWHSPFSPFDEFLNFERLSAHRRKLDLSRFNAPKVVGFHQKVYSTQASVATSATASRVPQPPFFGPPLNRFCLRRLPEVSLAELSRASAINALPVWFRVTGDGVAARIHITV